MKALIILLLTTVLANVPRATLLTLLTTEPWRTLLASVIDVTIGTTYPTLQTVCTKLIHFTSLIMPKDDTLTYL